jgi:WD40 repeat protein
LAAASLTGIVTVWDIARRVETAELNSAILAVAVRFSPDGKLVAVGDGSGTVTLWDPRRAARVGEPLVGGAGIVTSLDFDPSGKTIVTASGDGNLRLWDVASGKLIGGPLPGSTGTGSASFFPDGKHVLGVFGTGQGVVWNVDPASWRARACRVANRDLTPSEWSSFLPERRYRPVCPRG